MRRREMCLHPLLAVERHSFAFVRVQAEGLNVESEPLEGPDDMDDDWVVFTIRRMNEATLARTAVEATEGS